MNLVVKNFMTHAPLTIRHDESLAAAQRLMREYDIRHLPVLELGSLAGVLSQRDIYLIGTLKDVDLESVSVSEAMITEVFCVGPHASVREVAGDMVAHKYGSAVVMDGESVVGIFTTVDALAVLFGLLDPTLDARRSAPGRVAGDRAGLGVDRHARMRSR
jgi:acetoin utilization protein AcuB